MQELDKRTLASRRNGKLGGPKTEEGKLRSSANSYRHGLYAKRAPVLSTEDQQQYDLLRRELFDWHQPVGPQEVDIVTQLTDTSWRYHRYDGCQEWFLEGVMGAQAADLAKSEPNGIPHDARHAAALHHCLKRTNTPMRELSRMLERLQRTQQRLLNLLKDLQGPRFNAGGNQPQIEAEEHGNEPTTSLESTPEPTTPRAWAPLLPAEILPLEPESPGKEEHHAPLRSMAA